MYDELANRLRNCATQAAPCKTCDLIEDDSCSDTLMKQAADAIEELTAADVRPVVRGFNKLKDYPSLFECSVCGWECDDTMPGDTTTYNFCPNCGADMREES